MVRYSFIALNIFSPSPGHCYFKKTMDQQQDGTHGIESNDSNMSFNLISNTKKHMPLFP